MKYSNQEYQSYFFIGLVLLFLCIALKAKGQIVQSDEEVFTELAELRREIITNPSPSDRLHVAWEGFRIADSLDNDLFRARFKEEIANSHRAIGNLDSALVYYFDVARIFQKINPEGEAVTYNSIGLVYLVQENFNLAKQYLFKAISIHERLIESINVPYDNIELETIRNGGSDYNNLGEVYRLQQQFDSANILFDSALVNYQRIGDSLGQGYALGNIGLVYAEQGEYTLAQTYLDSATALLEPLGDFYPIAVYLTYTADIYEQTGRPAEAEKYLLESLEIATRLGLKEQIRDAARGLSDFYRRQGGLAQAMEYQDLYYSYRDSLYNAEIAQQNAEARASYEINLREVEKVALQRDKENLTYLAAAIGLGLLGIAFLRLASTAAATPPRRPTTTCASKRRWWMKKTW